MAELIYIVNNNNRKLKRIIIVYKMKSLFTTLETELINIKFITRKKPMIFILRKLLFAFG